MFWTRVFLAILAVSLSAPSALMATSHETDPESAAPADSAYAPERLSAGGHEVGHRVESREGEVCLTCGKPITKDDVTYMVDGQRVPVHKGACVGALAAKPGEWLDKLKPRGAFLDAGAATLGLSSGWLFFGSYILLGLIFGALAAHRAFGVGRDPLTWLIIGFITNIPGYAVLLALPRREVRALSGIPTGLGKVASTYSPEACPACGAENHPSALVCSGCGGALAPHVVSDVQRAKLGAR